MMNEVQKKKIVSVNFSHAVLCLLSAHGVVAMQALVSVQSSPILHGQVWHFIREFKPTSRI